LLTFERHPVMKNLIAFLSLYLSVPAFSQGVLESRIVGGSPTEECTMFVRSIDSFDHVEVYPFFVMSRIAMDAGDYQIMYWIDTVYLHGEFMHFSGNNRGVLQKFILRHPKPLWSVGFDEFELLTPEDFQDIFMEF